MSLVSCLASYSLQLHSDIHIIKLNRAEARIPQKGQQGGAFLEITTHPDLKAVMIQSAQKRCRHSLVVIVFFNMSRQIGHISSLCKDLGDTAISSPSVIASCVSMKQIEMELSSHTATSIQWRHHWYSAVHRSDKIPSFWSLNTCVFYLRRRN